jgi:succinoglycan biosynthesis transport protein ExoP
MASREHCARRFYLPPLSLLRAIWKRKLSVCLILLVGCGITAALVYTWPPTYKSRAVILVESQRIPQNFVAATVSDDLTERLSTLRERILGYSRLLEIIKKLDLYHKERETHFEEEIIETMRGDIDIQLERGWSQTHPGAFTITYKGKNPSIVALVANELGNLFIDENLRSREVQASSTSEFLENQLTEAKGRLEQQEAMLSKYKLEHRGELPEQENSLIATLSHLQTQLQGVQDALNRAQKDKTLIEDALHASNATLAEVMRIARRSETSSGITGGAASTKIKQLEARLTELRHTYTDDYPEVQSVQLSLTEARQRVAEKQAIPESGPSARPQGTAKADLGVAEIDDPSLAAMVAHERERLDNLKAQETISIQQSESLTAEHRQILDQIDSVQARLDRLPVREQQLTAVMRDYEITKANYRSLLDKKLAAGTAADMETRQKSERFTMLEPARVPGKPFWPNRPLCTAVGAAASLLLAIAFAIGKAFHENVVLGEWELPADVVILGRVPVIAPEQPAAESKINLLARPNVVKFAVRLLLAIIVLGIGTGFYLRWHAF